MTSLLCRWATLLGLTEDELALLLAVCLVLSGMNQADTIGSAAELIGAGEKPATTRG